MWFSFRDGNVSHSESQGVAHTEGTMMLSYWGRGILFLLEILSSKARARSGWGHLAAQGMAFQRSNIEECRAERDRHHFQMTAFQSLKLTVPSLHPRTDLWLDTTKSQICRVKGHPLRRSSLPSHAWIPPLAWMPSVWPWRSVSDWRGRTFLVQYICYYAVLLFFNSQLWSN